MTSRARRHHLVPRFLLARFADGRGLITVHDKVTGDEADRPPTEAAVETDFYTIDVGSGPSDEIERKFGELEGMAASALRRIDEGTFPPSNEDRGILATFMSLQYVRGTQFRAMNDGAATKSMSMVSRIAATKPEYVRRMIVESGEEDPTQEQLEAILESLGSGEVTVSLAREQQIGYMLSSQEAMFPFFAKRKWFLAEGEGFVTGDAPVVFWAKPIGSGPSFWGVGAMTADEIAMPISSEKALVLLHPFVEVDESRLSLPSRKVAVMRDRLWAHAARYTYRRPGTAQPASDVLPEDEPADAG